LTPLYDIIAKLATSQLNDASKNSLATATTANRMPFPRWADVDGSGNIDLEDARSLMKQEWDSFLDFALRDNVLEVAVGLIFASAFTTCANSLVSDIILPLVSLLPFLDRNIEQKFVILRTGDSHSRNWNTIEQALADGAVVWAWGSFVDKILRFFLIAVALFIISKIYGAVSHDNIIKKQVRCKYCRKWVSEKAKRCVNCTSWLDGREDSKNAPPPDPNDDGGE